MSRRPPFWDQLDLEPTEDARTIKLAYTRRLKAMDVDVDPAGFIALRAARDNALAYAAMRQNRIAAAPAEIQPEPPAAPAEAVNAAPDASAPPRAVDPTPPPPEPDPDQEQERLFNDELARLHKQLFAKAGDASAADLIRLTETILASPALDRVDRAAHAEQWMAATAINAIPRSDPILPTLISHYRWRAQPSAWRQPPAIKAVLARQAQCEFVGELMLTRHPWRQAYLELNAPPKVWWKQLNGVHNRSVRLLMSTIMANHPGLLRELNQETVAAWVKRVNRRPLMDRFWTWAAKYLPGGPRVWDVKPALRLPLWSLLLLIAFPIFRVWWLLRPGFSLRLRILAFSWTVIWVAAWVALHG